MRQRDCIPLLGGAAAGWPLSSLAQQPHKVPKIAFLTTASPPDRNTHKHSFEGLPMWAASKVTTLPLSGDGAVAQRNSSPSTRPRSWV
jgi:hypothetical protein